MAITGINPVSSVSGVFFPISRRADAVINRDSTFETIRLASNANIARERSLASRGTLTLVQNLPLPGETDVIDATDLTVGAEAYLNALEVARAANDNTALQLHEELALDARARANELLSRSLFDQQNRRTEDTVQNNAIAVPASEQSVNAPNLPEASTLMPVVATANFDTNPVRLSQAVQASLNGQNLLNTAPVFFDRPVSTEYDSGYTSGNNYRRILYRAPSEHTPEDVAILNVNTNIGALMDTSVAA